MIDPDSVDEIRGQYEKHGWILRRVLLSSPVSLADHAIFGSTEIRQAGIDALWFSRRSQPGREAWELRRISGSPFALVQVIDDESDVGERESILRETEFRMASAAAGPASH